MKKKKIILLGLILVLLVLIGVLVRDLFLPNKDLADDEKIIINIDPSSNLDWKFSNNIKDVFISDDDIENQIKTATKDYDCVGGAGASYYFNAKYATDILNWSIDWDSVALVIFDQNSCWDVYKFSIKNNDGWMISILSNDSFTGNIPSDEFNLKKADYFKEFNGYLESLKKLDIEVCSDYVPGKSGNAPSGGLELCIKKQRDKEELSYLCKSEPETLGIGREMYPIVNKYLSSDCLNNSDSCSISDNILGELFTADDCGDGRMKEIYGDSGNFHPFGLKMLRNRQGQYNFVNTLKEIGFQCTKGDESNCSEWLLNKQVKTEDLLKLKEFYLHGHFSMDDLYLQHLDNGDNYLQTKAGQSLYVSDNLNLKFIYADFDPTFKSVGIEEKCIITEKGNIIENSCGHLIEVIDKDPNISAYNAIAKLIPDMNYCDIEINRDPITNFDSAYRIVPKRDAFTELDIFSDVSACGSYVSFASNYHDIYYNEDFPNRLLISNWGGHEPAGTLEYTDGPVSFWVHTVEFF